MEGGNGDGGHITGVNVWFCCFRPANVVGGRNSEREERGSRRQLGVQFLGNRAVWYQWMTMDCKSGRGRAVVGYMKLHKARWVRGEHLE
jgi:hypothetical protein